MCAPAGPGLKSGALARCLPPQRAGDPLGLGIAPGQRPAAPPDPDAYDRAAEDAGYARSLLPEDARKAVDAEIEAKGYMTIDEVRKIVTSNSCKGETLDIDPEMMAMIDARINYKVFVVDDNIYSREELYDHFPFHEFATQPEVIFMQQEIGIFPPKKHTLRKDELEYMARDVGDESVDFLMLEDMVGLAARPADYKLKRPPLRIVKTKIYVGKEQWEDFALMQKLVRGTMRVAAAHRAEGATGAPNIFAALCGGGAPPAPLMITDPETLAAERAAREAETAAREAECARREAECARREEETQRRIDADLKRIEAMLAAASEVATLAKSAKPAKPAAAKPTAKPAGAAPVVKPVSAPAKPTAKPAPSKTTTAIAASDFDREFAALMFPDGQDSTAI
jgi:hypothetical protein